MEYYNELLNLYLKKYNKIFIEPQVCLLITELGVFDSSNSGNLGVLEDFQNTKDDKYFYKKEINDPYCICTENNIIYLSKNKNKNYYSAEDNLLIKLTKIPNFRNLLKKPKLVLNYIDLGSSSYNFFKYFGIQDIIIQKPFNKDKINKHFNKLRFREYTVKYL